MDVREDGVGPHQELLLLSPAQRLNLLTLLVPDIQPKEICATHPKMLFLKDECS